MPPASPARSRALVIAVIATGLLATLVVAALYLYYRHPATPTPEAQFAANDLGGALTQLNATLAANPNDVQALIDKSFTLAQQGSLGFQEALYGGEAATVAQQAIALDATSSEAYRALGYANEIQQNYADAHTAYEKAIALDPTNALALFDDAHAYDLQGDLAQAEAGYKASIAASRYTWQAYLGLARIDVINGDTTDAIADFKIVYGIDPNLHEKAEAAYSLGSLSIGQKDLDSAQKYYTEATLLDPTYPSGWTGLGTAYYVRVIDASSTTALSPTDRASDLLNSISALDTAVNLNPNQSIAYIQLAEDLSLIGKKTEALTAIADAAAAVPNDITLTPQGKAALLKEISAQKTQIEAGTGT